MTLAPFWQVLINLTQAPEPFVPNPFDENALLEWQEPENIRTFLFDPINSNPPASFGLKLVLDKKLQITFFTKAQSQLEGIEIAQAWLSSLRYKFIGLDAEIEVKQNNPDEIKKNSLRKFYEIILPTGLTPKRINIIQKFINAFYHNYEQTIKLYIIWQRVHDPKNPDKQSPLFHIRIFIAFNLKSENSILFSRIKGMLKFFSLDILNDKNIGAKIIDVDNLTSLDLFNGHIFKNGNNTENFFIKEDFNFDFPEDLPLPRIPILYHENVRYIDLDEEFIENAISVGNHIKNGVITDHTTYIPIRKLAQDLAIFGKSGTGKTYFLAKFINELRRKSKSVGILVLNVAKESQEIFYKDFEILRYSDDLFNVPYHFEGRSSEKSLQETATYICASLGLKNVFEKIIYRTMRTFLRINGKLPDSFIELLVGVEKYVQQNPYGNETQSNLIQALRNRIKVFDEKHIQNVMKTSDNLPKWIDGWLKGKKIFVDLSACNKFTKLLIVNAIFQLIRSITKDIETEELKHLIVIDEAHAILEKPITTNSDDADFIMKEQMTKIFSELLKEYRSRGVGFIIADQSPKRLFDDVSSQPSIKIIFRVDYPNNILFSEDIKERQLLTQLSNRLALVINGATGEKYLIKTSDFQI